MESIDEHLSKLSVETSEIRIEDIQEILKIMGKNRIMYETSKKYGKYCHDILEKLWNHMETGFAEFDDQLLCSTCFYAILLFSNKEEYYFKKVLEYLDNELDLKEKGMDSSNNISKTISLIYGIFQSSTLQQISEQSVLTIILEKIFTLLTLMAYKYSKHTFITFKIMTFFKKATGTALENVIFNRDHNLKLLNVINHNWENPITGVRSLNRIIFQNLISAVDDIVYDIIEQKLNGFYWNKAKYLMLADVIGHSQSNVQVLVDKYGIVEGLIYSLKKAGLVSAGTDMYVAILNKLTNEEEWCSIFLPSIKELIKGSSVKPIENFNNYWYLNTLKKFPSISQEIFDEIKNLVNANHGLYSCLCIIQQSNRVGLLEKSFINCPHLQELVLNNLDHNDIHVRVVSFNIMCGLHNKFLPVWQEYDLILDFLKNNVNSDNTILRINMIKSFQNFLTHLHMDFVNNYKYNKNCDIETLTTFCKQLQTFIIESLNFDGNYQRKIATIQIAKAMLITFKGIPRKKQKGTQKLQITLLDFMKSRNQWILSEKQVILKFIRLLKDPSDDIREHAKDVLLNNYMEELSKNEMTTYLIEEGLSCIKSRFFYQITCGQTIFKLILNILMIGNCTASRFKNIEDIFDFAYSEIKSECNSDTDIVKSIVEGKQIHSYLNILHSIFEISLEKSYKLNISICGINALIELLKNISNQFAWEQDATVSSDFSKMNDMVQKLIASSECQIHYQFNETNISGLHQIVLNCLWLNVKASCELSSVLVQYYKKDDYEVVCGKCLQIICNVLETSRHKGAIEAGGSSLGQAVQQLTSLPSGSLISKIPMLLLKGKFKQLVAETSTMASVTRRGAGLSIMIHRIVSNDMKKGKPLFHYFMQKLLEACDKPPEYCNHESEFDTNNEKDLPQAIYIHFLTKIVTDSSLSSDMMYYSGKLAKLAFDNLSSSCWQIRNAALQLYGSLIPKLIGQKKNSGASDEVMATVAVDEFRTHSPKLWEYIQTQLEVATKSHCDMVQCHNNLVPILSILANLAPFYSFTNKLDYKESLLPSLISLLGSPIYVVRRLVSKCILNIYQFETVLDTLLSCTTETENSLHGTLVLLNEFNKQYNIKIKEEFSNILETKFRMLMSRKCSYLSREQFDRTFPDSIKLTEKMVKEVLAEIESYSTYPGLFLWANFRIQLYIENTSWDRIPNIVKLISDCCNFETYCETLCKRIESEKFINEEIVLNLFNHLYSLGFKRQSAIVWRTLYVLSLHTQLLDRYLDTTLIHQYCVDNGVCSRMRYILPLAIRMLTANASEELLYLSNIIFNLSNPDTDVDMRLIAVTANNEFASKFGNLSDCIKINLIKATVMFLQDEDEDIRNLSVHFYRKVNICKTIPHPYICLRRIMSTEFLYKVLNNPQIGIQVICKDILDLLTFLNSHNDDEYNPFTSDSKNIYLEPDVLKSLCSEICLDIQ